MAIVDQARLGGPGGRPNYGRAAYGMEGQQNLSGRNSGLDNEASEPLKRRLPGQYLRGGK
ncbi:hypothetical protein CHELA20_53343 [Hyphomicrobiales bacterium]|nr:hypothetical protein CHELA41_21582 [Hyphomicrobiales bacterium]CAH1684060.1 hypothetical protein CHELA20_53343 [Hyphomicrobiales bacterium]